MRFTFGIPIRDTLYDYLLVFDSDSLAGNDEIFGILEVPFGYSSKIINISNIPGNDNYPAICYCPNYGIVSIVWQHEGLNGNEIWWAQAPYELIYGAIDRSNVLPQTLELRQNYPNPLNPVTTIEYHLPYETLVKITVYNLAGQTVSVLVDQVRPTGIHRLNFDASTLASGLYFYRIEASGFIQTRKMVVLK